MHTYHTFLRFEESCSFTQTHCTTHVSRMMLRHVNDKCMLYVRINFSRVCGLKCDINYWSFWRNNNLTYRKIQHISGKLNNGRLQTKTDAKERFLIFATPLAGTNLALDAS